MSSVHNESEYLTRRQRIDPLLQAQGWTIAPYDTGVPLASSTQHALTEYETANDPVDYALSVADHQVCNRPDEET
jgi:hypothetical protein